MSKAIYQINFRTLQYMQIYQKYRVFTKVEEQIAVFKRLANIEVLIQVQALKWTQSINVKCFLPTMSVQS